MQPPHGGPRGLSTVCCHLRACLTRTWYRGAQRQSLPAPWPVDGVFRITHEAEHLSMFPDILFSL